MQVTVTLKKVLVGTEVNIVQEGIPDVIPVEACYLGWQESLRNLAGWSSPRSSSSSTLAEPQKDNQAQWLATGS